MYEFMVHIHLSRRDSSPQPSHDIFQSSIWVDTSDGLKPSKSCERRWAAKSSVIILTRGRRLAGLQGVHAPIGSWPTGVMLLLLGSTSELCLNLESMLDWIGKLIWLSVSFGMNALNFQKCGR